MLTGISQKNFILALSSRFQAFFPKKVGSSGSGMLKVQLSPQKAWHARLLGILERRQHTHSRRARQLIFLIRERDAGLQLNQIQIQNCSFACGKNTVLKPDLVYLAIWIAENLLMAEFRMVRWQDSLVVQKTFLSLMLDDLDGQISG